MLSGCGSILESKEQTVQKAAQARWDALLSDDFDKAYLYTTKGFQQIVSKRQYPQRYGGAVSWLGAKVVQVECPQADKCVVRIRLTFKVRLNSQAGPADSFFNENWILEDGQWRIVHNI